MGYYYIILYTSRMKKNGVSVFNILAMLAILIIISILSAMTVPKATTEGFNDRCQRLVKEQYHCTPGPYRMPLYCIDNIPMRVNGNGEVECVERNGTCMSLTSSQCSSFIAVRNSQTSSGNSLAGQDNYIKCTPNNCTASCSKAYNDIPLQSCIPSPAPALFVQ